MPDALRILQLNSARKYIGEAAHTLNLTEALRRAGARDRPPRFAAVVLRAARHLLQPIYDVESTDIAFGHVALIGDASGSVDAITGVRSCMDSRIGKPKPS